MHRENVPLGLLPPGEAESEAASVFPMPPRNADLNAHLERNQLRQRLFEGDIDTIQVDRFMRMFNTATAYRQSLPDAWFHNVQAEPVGNGTIMSTLRLQTVMDLWGWQAKMAGVHDNGGCRLYGAAAPMCLKAGDISFLELHGDLDQTGPAISLSVDRNTAGCQMKGKVRILGKDAGTLSVNLDTNGFQTHLAPGNHIYAGSQLIFQRGRFFLDFNHDVPKVLHGQRMISGLKVKGTVECTPGHFRQALTFSLITDGEEITSPSMRWHEPLTDEESLYDAYQLAAPFFQPYLLCERV